MSPSAIAELPLRDIHLPTRVSFWPPAPGWWVLAGLVGGGLLATWLLRRWRARRRRQLALCDALARVASNARDAHGMAVGVNLLLRGLVQAQQPGARLQSGEAWLRQLRSLAPLADDDAIRIGLLLAPYDPQAAYDTTRLVTVVDGWLRRLPMPRPAPRHV